MEDVKFKLDKSSEKHTPPLPHLTSFDGQNKVGNDVDNENNVIFAILMEDAKCNRDKSS